MDWNCTLTEERLSEVLDGALGAGEAAAFSLHAAGCLRCSQLVAQMGAFVRQLRQLPELQEPPFLASRIISATREASAQERSANGWLAWLPAIWTTRLAVGVVTVVVSFLIVLHGVGTIPHGITLNPVNLYHNANRHAHLAYARGVKFVNDLRVVYLIQSRLTPERQPASEAEPTAEPEATPNQHQPDSYARPKSPPAPQTDPDRVQRTELAMLIVSTGPRDAMNNTWRSLP